MAAALDEALAAGAAGLSSGLAYSTAQAAPAAEVAALARRVTGTGGLYATHLRDEAEHIIERRRPASRAGLPHLLTSAAGANYAAPRTLAWLAIAAQGRSGLTPTLHAGA
jgi:N-acyl-D-aspartate/D-glutamate deacylase